MLPSKLNNSRNSTSLTNKIYLFISKRAFPELIKEILNNGFPSFFYDEIIRRSGVFKKVREG